jgi:crotonobetainyl-CoA:carnitine CoA-transferase CaiB-like acyl-CoA transferase
MSGSLTGIRVADFSRVLAGPYATMLLADLGADVVKVERPPLGDDTRSWLPPVANDGQSSYFHAVNRNKRSRALDLSTPEGRAAAHDLIRESDVVVENFMPGTMERFGLDYHRMSADNPDLIYCSITGFGEASGADLPGYDLLVQAMGGLMSITGSHPGDPTKAGVAVVDVLTGLHASVGILAALHHRENGGGGQRIEVTLLGSLLASLVNQASAYIVSGVEPGIMGNAHPSIAPYELYETLDRPLIIAVGNDRQFGFLVTALGLPELSDDVRFRGNPDRVANRAELKEELERVLITQSADTWQELLNREGVPCGPINSIPQAFELATRLGLEPIQTIDVAGQPLPTVANPIRMSRTPIHYRLAPPRVGEDQERE